MAEAVNVTTSQAAPNIYEPLRVLLRAGQNDEAIAKLCGMVVTRPDDLAAKELLFDAFFQKREWLPAVVLAEELARRQPDIARLQKALIVDAVEYEALRRGDRSSIAVHRAAWRRTHDPGRAEGRAISIPARSKKRSIMVSARSRCVTQRPAETSR